MSELFKRIFQICLLVKGPQDLPFSPFLMQLGVAVYFFTGLLSTLTQAPLASSLGLIVLDVVVLMSFSWVCLQSFKLQERFAQTITALCGTGSLFNLLSIPLFAQVNLLEHGVSLSVSLSLLLLFLISWNLAVIAHIFRESFNVRLPVAFVLTLALVIIEESSSQIIFPQLGT